MMTVSSVLVSPFISNREYVEPPSLDNMTNRKKRRKKRERWWLGEIHLNTLFTFIIIFLILDFSAASSHNDGDVSKAVNGWVSANNVFMYDNGIQDVNNEIDVPRTEYVNVEKAGGGTPWATAKEEAFDERRDAEIFEAVLRSIAEWKERRRIRYAKKKEESKSRKKRSQDENGKEKKLDEELDKEPTKVCYEELGCFQEAGYIDLLPNSPEEVNTRYLLYNSRKSRGDTPLLDVSAQNISSLWEWVGKAFNVSAPTKVIVHGFGSSCSNVWVYEMRSALMSVEECNIICVDWEAGATIPNYVRAAANTRLVGKQVAILLSGLEKYVNLSVRNVHVIGFSLGAHVAGFAGSELKNLSRITGLDPAGPLFESQDRRARLDSMDAQFVDVIHSNGENLILGGLGAWQPMGHVDFYPNGGRMQKGCTNLFVGAVSDMIWSANEVYGRSLCNHRRAYKFFTDSVSPRCQFPAVPCESYDHFVEGKCFPCDNLKDCNNMGYHADKFSGRGTLFLLTRDEEPFCANQYMVKVENSPDKESSTEKSVTFGKIQITLIGDLELNETFIITQKKDEKLISGDSVSRIIVPHPALQNFLEIQVLYVAYNGWLSSGTSKWRVNKISLTNSYGHVLSACKEDLVLESGIPVILQLVPRNCNVHENDNHSSQNSSQLHSDAKNNLINEIYRNQSLESLYPRTQVVRIGNEILKNNEHISTKLASDRSNTTKEEKPQNKTFENVTKIGIGVTEYLNDPWKQKPDADSATAASVHNHLDESKYDNGGGRNLVYVNAPAKEESGDAFANQTNTSLNATETIAEIPAQKKKEEKVAKEKSPYEFVTEQMHSDTIVVYDPQSTKSTETEITEPVLKPKTAAPSFTGRSRKSQNTYRPNYGKSINVVPPKWRTSTITAFTKIFPNIVSSTSPVANHSNAGANSTVNVTTSSPDISASSLRWSKTNDSDSSKKYDESKNSSQLFVIQFLPQKLISFFEQAERYARLAFLPFISPSDNSKHPQERSRRIRTFNTNRWNSASSKEVISDRYDLSTDESKNIGSVLLATSPTKSSLFPYTYQHSPRQLWQHVVYPDSERKYIPLINVESKSEQEQPVRHVDSSK